ncbi:MAG: hypothetical protein ACJAUQ_002004 [Maribacter sp.]|jgi:hypothetical protein
MDVQRVARPPVFQRVLDTTSLSGRHSKRYYPNNLQEK